MRYFRLHVGIPQVGITTKIMLSRGNRIVPFNEVLYIAGLGASHWTWPDGTSMQAVVLCPSRSVTTGMSTCCTAQQFSSTLNGLMACEIRASSLSNGFADPGPNFKIECQILFGFPRLFFFCLGDRLRRYVQNIDPKVGVTLCKSKMEYTAKIGLVGLQFCCTPVLCPPAYLRD